MKVFVEKKVNGSITIESAFVFPLVVFVLIFVISIILYLQDITSIYAYLYGYEMNGEVSYDEREIAREVRDIATIVDITEVTVRNRDDTYTISIHTDWKILYWNLSKEDCIRVQKKKMNYYRTMIKQKAIIDSIHGVMRGGE